MEPADLIASSSVAAVVSDPRLPDNPIVACNDAFVALTGFAREIGVVVVAEGLETKAELAVVCDLGIDAGQGFLLGRPMPYAEAIRWAQARAKA